MDVNGRLATTSTRNQQSRLSNFFLVRGNDPRLVNYMRLFEHMVPMGTRFQLHHVFRSNAQVANASGYRALLWVPMKVG